MYGGEIEHFEGKTKQKTKQNKKKKKKKQENLTHL